MRLKRSLDDKIGYAITLSGLAVLYRESGLCDEGRMLASEALDIVLAHGTPRQIVEARKVLETFDEPTALRRDCNALFAHLLLRKEI